MSNSRQKGDTTRTGASSASLATITDKALRSGLPLDQQPEAQAREIVAEAQKLQDQAANRQIPLSWASAVSMAAARLKAKSPEHMGTLYKPLRPLAK